jgi:hypothetical protein
MEYTLPLKFEVHLENVRRSTLELRDKLEKIYVHERKDTNINQAERKKAYDAVDTALNSQGEDFTIGKGSLLLYKM